MQQCSYHIQFADPGHLPVLRSMWAEIFGDCEAYINLFFSHVYTPARALIAMVDGQVAAMLFFPSRRMILQGKAARVGYVCGAATRPAYRGAGIMAAMLQAAHSQMRRAGDAGAVLIPASQSLYAYYEKHGYRDFFYQDTLLLTDSPPDTVPARLAPLTDAGPVLPVYNAFASTRPDLVLQDTDSYALVLKEYAGYGRLYLWDQNKYLFCRRAQDQIIVDECISAAPLTKTALEGLFSALKAEFPGTTSLSMHTPAGCLPNAMRMRNGMLCQFNSARLAGGLGYMNMMLN